MADPRQPYPISGTVYEEDGSTVLTDATVTIWSVTNQEWMETDKESTTASDGTYVIDLADMPTAYANGDKIQVLIYKGNKVIEYRHTVSTSTESHEETTATIAHIYPKSGKAYTERGIRIISGFVSNSDSSNSQYVDFFDRANDEKHRVQVPKDDTISLNFIHVGKFFEKGYCIVFEDYTEDELDVCLVVK